MSTMSKGVAPGDFIPWFSAQYISGAPFDIHVSAGRWVILAFFGNLADPRAQEKFALFLNHVPQLSEDQRVAYCIFTARPCEADLNLLISVSSPALKFVADYDGRLSRTFGALDTPRTLVLDPLLRVFSDIPWDSPQGHDQALKNLLASLPLVDDHAGVPLTAPALIVPRVLDLDFCELLVKLHDTVGGTDFGFLLDQNGKTATVIDYQKKRRQDMIIALPELREKIRTSIVTRLLPSIERFFMFQATRMDRYIVSCYDSALGGHFRRHRDNLNAGAEHRRLAVSINLNSGYTGCDLIFPEFGRRTYRAPLGGAIVFSCGALHEVTPITAGRRYAFVPFLYGEADAKLRLENNARLEAGEAPYKGDKDRLYPER